MWAAAKPVICNIKRDSPFDAEGMNGNSTGRSRSSAKIILPRLSRLVRHGDFAESFIAIRLTSRFAAARATILSRELNPFAPAAAIRKTAVSEQNALIPFFLLLHAIVATNDAMRQKKVD